MWGIQNEVVNVAVETVAVAKAPCQCTLWIALALSVFVCTGFAKWCYDWSKVMLLAFEKQDFVRMKKFLTFAWQNKTFIEHWDESGGEGSDNTIRVVDDATVTMNDITHCFVERKSVLLWRNFIPEETMKQFENIKPTTFKDKTYPFAASSSDPIVKNGQIFRPLINVAVRDAMKRMKGGEKLYLGFNTSLADDNPEIKRALGDVLEKVNERGHFFNEGCCLTHSFLYWGNRFQAALHQAMVQDFSIQLSNSKLWRFIRPEFTPRMKAFRSDVPGVLYSDLGVIAGTGIPYSEVLVRPGDLLVFPEHWWHEVHNVEDEGYGLMIGFRDVSPRHFMAGLYSSPAQFCHKALSLLDTYLHPLSEDSPEYMKAGVCLVD